VEFVTSGLADVGTGRPVTVHTTFLWFSMTKIVTATAAMMLADRGALDLDAPAAEHVPEMCVLHRPASLITARHLLAHSAGLANPPPIRWVRPAGVPPPDSRAFLARLLHRYRRLRFRPGDTASYSNLGYLVLGELIASCAGQAIGEFVQRQLLEPLGMSRTGFEHAQTPADIATGYWRLPPGGRAALRLLLPPGIVGQRVGGLVAFRPSTGRPTAGSSATCTTPPGSSRSTSPRERSAASACCRPGRLSRCAPSPPTATSSLPAWAGWRRHETDGGSKWSSTSGMAVPTGT
jgi:CubicO group peptidase (beta-lactamase class C family)